MLQFLACLAVVVARNATADAQRLARRRHRLTQLVRQHEGRFVLHIKVAAEGQHALAPHFVAEHRDGHQVSFQRQLVPGEQRAGRHREIRATRLAAPARLGVRASAVIANLAAALWADRFAVGLRPAQAEEHILRASIGHPHDLGWTERASRRGQKEVLRHQNRLD